MPANYSMNPANPENQTGGQDAQIPVQRPREPSNIRDYLNLARSQGQVPTFTNKPGGQGYLMQEPEPQAIPEGPQSEYERLPFGQRMKISPYIRAQERVQTMLPELWEMMFPGMGQGAILQDFQMKQWTGAVETLTGRLLKQYDKHYEWSMKNEMKAKESKDKDRRFWHSKFIDAELRGNPPLNKETGQPLTETEFVDQRIAAQDEMRFREDMSAQERRGVQPRTLEDFDPKEIRAILQKNPDMARMIKADIMKKIGEIAGRPVTEAEFDAMHQDPQWMQVMNESVREILEQYQDQIIDLAGK